MTLTVRIRHDFGGFGLDLGFDAPPGVTALFGRSGAGKSTVVNAIAGLLRPQSGRIALNDRVLFDSDSGAFLPPHQRRIGYVFQDARLFPHLSVRQNLLYGRWFARRRASSDARQFARITEMLGINALLSRRPGALSGGERRRIAIGRALLSNPRLLLMDEPMAALDEERKAEILPYLERLRDETRLPILYVSHSPCEVARLATTVVLLDGGRVTAAGPATSILADPAAAQGFGPREAGAVITARIEDEEDDGLTRLQSTAGPIWVPSLYRPKGEEIRLRILAQDVMLALTRPEGVSALNVLPARILRLEPAGDAILVQLALDASGEQMLLARITRRSQDRLGLTPGLSLYAVLKAVAVTLPR